MACVTSFTLIGSAGGIPLFSHRCERFGVAYVSAGPSPRGALFIVPMCGCRPYFTCPVCGWRSKQLQDVQEGYCGHCHDWTGQREITFILTSPEIPDDLDAIDAVREAFRDTLREAP